MKSIIICITNDIIYDRRIQRCAQSLSKNYNVKVISRKKISASTSQFHFKSRRIKCLFNKGFLFYAEFNLRLLFALLFEKADAIVAVDYDTLLPVIWSTKIKNSKRIFDAHEYFEESIEITKRPRIKLFWSKLGLRYIKKFGLAYSVSNSISDIYTRLHKVKFHTIYNCPEYIKDTQVKTLSNKKIILYQGVLNEGRKLELLIDTASFLSSDYEIWIIGEGDISDRLKSKSKLITTECPIHFYSWVEPNELFRYTRQATLAFNLLDSDSLSYFYSLANKFFDYLHAGIPSINNAFPEYEKINNKFNCCYTIDIDSPEELSKFIIREIQNIGSLEEKRTNSFLASKTFNWLHEEKKLLNLYADLLN